MESVPADNMKKLFEFKPQEWESECREIKDFLDQFGRRIPYEIRQSGEGLARRIRRAGDV